MIPESGADLGHDYVTRLHATPAGKLSRHAKVGRIHRSDANVMNNVDCALRDVGPLDHITELAFVQTRFRSIAQCGHAKIAEMCADAQPIELLGGLHLTQPDVVTAQAFRLA